MPGDKGRQALMHGSRRARRPLRRLATVAILACMPGFAMASNLATEQERLLQVTLAQPTNYDAAFDYVRVSIELRDYEAAIGTLERLLLYNVGLTRVRYELGALYFKLGSYEMAARYFREALASPDLDPTTRARIAVALPAAEKQLQPSRVSAFVQTGLRYQSNANFAPDGGIVRFTGIDIPLLPGERRRADWNAFALAGISHDFDLQNQRGDLIETRIVGYGTKPFRFGDLSVGFLEASVGPRLALSPDLWPKATIKPYAVGGFAIVDTDRYASGGLGVVMGLPLSATITIEPGVEWRVSDVDNGGRIPFDILSSGESLSVGLGSTTTFAEGLSLQTRSAYRVTDGTLPWQSHEQFLSEAALAIEFAPPAEWMARQWTLSPHLRYARTEFDRPNPFVDPARRRQDNEWRVGVLLDAPITEVLGVSAAVQYSRNDSNIPNYRSDNLSFIIGPTARF
jgi:hypothetical protein